MYRSSLVAEHEGRMGTIHRSILLENRASLRRRWAVAQNNEIDPQQLAHWFPDQRTLFDILKVSTPEEVDRMADCTFPLFHLRPMSVLRVENAPDEPEKNPGDVGRSEEVYNALIARLDSIRTAEHQARVSYYLKVEEVRWLDKFCPIELRRISFEPAVRLHLATADKYFIATGNAPLTRSDRSLLAVTGRTA